MSSFEIGDIVVVKPEYASSFRNIYEGHESLFNRHKVRFGISVSEGAPARVVHTTYDGIDLTDLDNTLSPNSWLCTEREWFELYQERGPIEQLL